jgi:hypothetical protein
MRQEAPSLDDHPAGNREYEDPSGLGHACHEDSITDAVHTDRAVDDTCDSLSYARRTRDADEYVRRR